MAKKHDIIWLDTVDSTNDEARRRISYLDNLSVLSASEQTAGRGQRGNTWSAAAGKNLTFTVILKYGHGALPSVRAVDQFAISEITALTVVELLAANGMEAKIKWPNDIYVGDRKICGILIENSVHDSFLSSSIIGVGLNVNQTEFDPSLPNPTSMLLHKNAGSIDIHEILKVYMDIFCRYVDRYLNITGGMSRLRRLYLSQMWRKDVPARFIDNSDGREFEGIIRGLNQIGLIMIEDIEKGELREFAFKEISYII